MSIARKIVWMLIAALASAGAAWADRSVSESRAADKDVEVSIEVLAGEVTVIAWDEARVSVEGTLGDDVESLEIDGEGSDIEIVVEVPDHIGRNTDVDANLEIRVPRGAEVEVESLSADITISGISGDARAESVSGDVTLDTDSESIEAAAVSGDVIVTASGVQDVEVEAVSGDVMVEGINGGISAEVVSGDIDVTGSLSEAEIEAVSGNITIVADLMPGARIEINALNGTVDLAVPASTSARFRVETFSGTIKSDFGTASRTDQYAPGMELDATVGSGDAEVEIECFSGTVRIHTQ